MNKRFIVSSLITIGLLYFILKKVGLGEIVGSLKRINGLSLSLVFVLMPLQLFLKIYKWHYLLRLNEHSIKFQEAAKSLLGGIGIGIITPARVGEITRVFYLKSSQRLRLSGLVIIDKFFDLFVVTALAIGGLTLVLKPSINVLLILLLILLFYFLFNPKRIKNLLQRLTNYLPFKSKISEVVSSLDTLSWRVSGFLLFFTFLAFIVDFLQFYLLILSFGNVSLKAVAFSFPLVILANVLPITVGGLGVREGVSVISLSLFNVAKEVAVNASFLLFFINTLIPGIVGIFLVHKIRIKK